MRKRIVQPRAQLPDYVCEINEDSKNTMWEGTQMGRAMVDGMRNGFQQENIAAWDLLVSRDREAFQRVSQSIIDAGA